MKALIAGTSGVGTSGSVRRFSDNDPYACSLANISDTGAEVNAHTSILGGESYGFHWVCNAEV